MIHFSFLPAYALGEGASVLAGQALGARREGLVLPIARRALAVSAIYTAACTLVLVVFGRQIVAGFGAGPELARATIALLYVAALFQIADGANVVARAVLRGVGDVRYPAIVGIAIAWLITPPLTWLLGFRLGLGALGGWLGLCLEIIVTTVLFWRRLTRLGREALFECARLRLDDDARPFEPILLGDASARRGEEPGGGDELDLATAGAKPS